jgi:DNA repair exonuclease SbcCD nuclease subunit
VFKILLLADTHLGFDLPARPRVERRRRGPDFFANTRRALEPALRGEVDVVVHGGDLLYRSKVPPALVAAALEPLLEVADSGVPVLLVPGNHERSALPFPLLASHANLHVFDRPRTVVFELNGVRAAFSGFPCERTGIQTRFRDLVEATGWRQQEADLRLLCVHQTVEGAKVHNYTFRGGADIIRGRDIPGEFAAVLSGHIHRSQVLEHDLAGRRLAAPVLYPGSVERTSLAERHEAKGFLTISIEPGGKVVDHVFHELPARPMCAVVVDPADLDADALSRRLADEFSALDPDSVVQVRVDGDLKRGAEAVLRVANLRSLHPPTMTVDLRFRQARDGKLRT